MCTRSKKKEEVEEKPESKSMININSKLPPHIIQVIFAKLPIVSFSPCRFVCKAWNDLILDHASTSKFVKDTFFVRTVCHQEFPQFLDARSHDMWPGYLRMLCIDFDEKHLEGMNIVASFRFDISCPNIVRISNSCNGLLCIIKETDAFSTCAAILNPMTNEYIQLPGENSSKDSRRFYDYGFSFSPKTNQYKVARVWQEKTTHSCMIEIFTLGKSSKWSHVDVDSSSPFIIESDGVYFNGALYWIGVDREWKKVVFRLDVEDESFEKISLPKAACSVAIGAFNGSLYATLWERGHCKIQAWRMGSNGEGKEDAWVLEFVVDDVPKEWGFEALGSFEWRGQLQLIKTCENGEIMCVFDKFHLFLYDLKTRRIKTLTKNRRDGRVFWIYQIDSLNFDSLQKILVG